MSGGEGQPARVVGVTRNGEVANVVGVMVEAAETAEIPGVGGPAVLPVDQVMALDARAGAAGEPAAAVAVLDQPAGPGGDDALGAADVDRCALREPYRLQDPVAGHLGFDVLRQPGLAGQPAALGIEEDEGPVGIAAVDRLHSTHGAPGNLDHGIA